MADKKTGNMNGIFEGLQAARYSYLHTHHILNSGLRRTVFMKFPKRLVCN